jgi:hypothetical protein
LFIDPDVLQADYARSPDWLKALMNAWADGLNYYLAKHPQVKPKLIAHFEPWMALSFSEGSIGGDIEDIKLTQLEDFYGKRKLGMTDDERGFVFHDPGGSNGIAIAPSDSMDGHALLLINPHTTFFFRSELQVDERRRPECLWRGDLGTVLRLSGIQRACRLDAHVDRRGQCRRVCGRHRRRRTASVITATAKNFGRWARDSSRCRIERPAAAERRGHSRPITPATARSFARPTANGSAFR